MSGERPFDEVRFVSERGTTTLSLQEFLALKLPVRVRVILDVQTTFFAAGRLIDKRAALAALKTWKGEP